MGAFKINDVDILSCATPVADLEGRTESAFTSANKIRGVSAQIDVDNYKLPTAWQHDCVHGKIKINDVPITIAYDGTRPMNKACYEGELNQLIGNIDVGLGYKLYNQNGFLQIHKYSTEGTQVEFTRVVSKHPDKLIIVNVIMWGSGGAGGNGAYFTFLDGPAGNYGGIGGGSGARMFYTLMIPKGKSFNFLTYDSDKEGRNAGRINVNTQNTANGPPCRLVDGETGADYYACNGGINGMGCNGHDYTDQYSDMHVPIGVNDAPCPYVTIHMQAEGQSKSPKNGDPGKSSLPFTYVTPPYFGNPENAQGELVLSAAGGSAHGPWTDDGYGSGGAAGYGPGGDAGSPGSNGIRGGGGGGSNAVNWGQKGGYGSPAGFIIFY